MTEITKGIINAVKDRMDESILLALIFNSLVFNNLHSILIYRINYCIKDS